MNISLNLQAIDTIKGGILTEIAKLYNILADYDDSDAYESAADELATVIAMEYILARRLGIGYGSVDSRTSDFLAMAEENGHELELEFSDMSELNKYIKKR